MRRVGRALWWAAVLGLLAVAARVLWCGYGPHDPDVAAQVRFVNAAADDGAGPRMQQLFPEGEVFVLVLAGLAAPADDSLSEAEQIEVMTTRLERLRSEEVRAPFGGPTELPDGAFYSGWTLLLEVERARLSDDPGHRREVGRHATTLREALDAAPTGFVESYPGQTWPVDNVVAVAALVRADELVGVPGTEASVQTWLERVDARRDPATGLLPHRVAPGGSTIDPPRATSQSLVQLFWPEIDPDSARASWRAYVETFVDRRAGLVGVREHPKGVDAGGDVDSGPLVLGVSLSATVVTMAAARAHGELTLAEDLSREGELVGLPWQWAGERRYAGGMIPVGDAFLAWARATPAADGPPVESTDLPRPLWWWHAGVPLAAVALLVLSRTVGRGRARYLTLTRRRHR